MSRNGGLAPISDKKTARGKIKTDDFGDQLEDILDKPSKKNMSLDALDNSFDSYNSTSLASESFPSPMAAKFNPKGRSSPTPLLSAGKGAVGGAAGGRNTYINDSVDLDSSGGNLEESQGTSPGGYVPTAAATRGAGAGVNSNKGSSSSSSSRRTDDFDYEIDLPDNMTSTALPSGSGKNTSGKSGGASSNLASAAGGGGGDDQLDEASTDLGGGFVPSIASKPRQRRQLLSSTTATTSSGGNVGASLDELDSMLGFRPTTAPAPAAPAGNSSSNMNNNVKTLGDYESSDEESRAKVASKGEKIRKNLSVRIDTDSTGGTLESGTSETSYEPAASNTPGRSLGGGKASAVAASSPAWLGDRNAAKPKSPKASERNSAAANSEQTIRSLHREAESAQLEREAIERQLRLEIEALKGKLARAEVGTASGNFGERDHVDVSVAGSRQLQESSDLRKQIAQQDVELARLRDEVTLAQLKHNEEVKYMTQRHGTELRDLRDRKDQEIAGVEKRHGDAVKALKSIHLEELASVKDRSKDGVALHELTQQLKSASGSIRLLEEQLLSKHRGLEAAKEGQMEARERLLADMEEKARLRADGAEAETYRLKGLLMHMEHVASSMRSQGGEEKDRLRQEHQRLYTLQSTLESEKTSFYARVSEELALLKQKTAQVDSETSKLATEKRQQQEALATVQRALDADRSEFATYVMAHTKQAEATTERFKEEESRLTRAKEELARDRAILEQRKASAAGDLQEAEALRNALVASRDEVVREKTRLQQAVAELNAAAAQLTQQGETLDKQARVLDARERSSREGQAQLRLADSALRKREKDLVDGMKELEARMQELGSQDRELTTRRMDLMARGRELSSMSAKKALESNNITIVQPQVSPPKKADKSGEPTKAWEERRTENTAPVTGANAGNGNGDADSKWLVAFQERLASGKSSGRATDREKKTHDQLLQSRKVLQAAKSTLLRTSSTRVQSERLITDEAVFLATMQRAKGEANAQ